MEGIVIQDKRERALNTASFFFRFIFQRIKEKNGARGFY
jgi:hypothetical protein